MYDIELSLQARGVVTSGKTDSNKEYEENYNSFLLPSSVVVFCHSNLGKESLRFTFHPLNFYRQRNNNIILQQFLHILILNKYILLLPS